MSVCQRENEPFYLLMATIGQIFFHNFSFGNPQDETLVSFLPTATFHNFEENGQQVFTDFVTQCTSRPVSELFRWYKK